MRTQRTFTSERAVDPVRSEFGVLKKVYPLNLFRRAISCPPIMLKSRTFSSGKCSSLIPKHSDIFRLHFCHTFLK